MVLDKVKEAIAEFDLLKKGDRVLIGVSGGPDSTALLYILNALRKDLDIELFAAHLNHMVRKGAAEKDAMFVKRAAEKLGIPAVTESKDVPALAREGRFSVEEAGRIARYDFYLRAAKRFKAGRIALGHTADDQAETILMRLIRGAGLLGLSGIPVKRRLQDRMIIRPLIKVSKDEIIKYLKARKIPYAKDITNTQSIYLRNKIRNRLIPFLEREFNPEIKKALKSAGENLRIDYELLLKIAEKKFKKYARCKKGAVKIDLGFLREDPAIRRMVIREVIKNIKGDLASVSYGHIEDLNRQLKKVTRWTFHLPGNILIKRRRADLLFFKQGVKSEADLTGTAYKIKIPGETDIPEVNKILEADFVRAPKTFKSKRSRNEEFFDLKGLRFPLFVRFRRPKDKIKVLGMKNYKRLKQLFIDEKISFDERGGVPLVVSGKEIIWACGVKRSDCAKIDENTKTALRIRVS